MKGLILAGGTGTRLYPLTKVTNKHLLPVGHYPMIYHAIFKFIAADIRDILIVTGKEHMGDVVNLLGSGADFMANFTYRVQDEAGGIAQALSLGEQFVENDLVTVILADNVFEDDLSQYIGEFAHGGQEAKILIKRVEDPRRYGVPELRDGKIVSIEEKPDNPKSSYAVTGIYMYDHRVFDIIRMLRPSSRGELEITDVNNAYVRQGTLSFEVLKGWWTDAGTHESLLRAHQWASSIIYELPQK